MGIGEGRPAGDHQQRECRENSTAGVPRHPRLVPVRAHRPLAGSSITSATVVVEADGKTFISTCANVTSASQPNL